MSLTEQELIRRASLTELRNLGIEPYPAAAYPVSHFTLDIKNQFNELEGKEVTLAGD